MSNETKVVLLALLNALLLAAGVGFQKLNAVRGASPVVSPYIVGALLCLFPTFFITNVAFALGGKMSTFVPLSALSYVFAALLARFGFGEAVGAREAAGLALILAGVTLLASGRTAAPV